MKTTFNVGQLKVFFTSIVFQSLNDMWEVGKSIVVLQLLRLLFVGRAIVYRDPKAEAWKNGRIILAFEFFTD